MKNKDSTVKTKYLHPYLQAKLYQLDEIHTFLTGLEMVITSGNDSKHWGGLPVSKRPAGWKIFLEAAVRFISKSLHYSWCAVDIRDWYIAQLSKENKKIWKKEVERISGYMCDFVVEGDHFHFELEIKRLLKRINKHNKSRTFLLIGKLKHKEPIQLNKYDSGEPIEELMLAVEKAKPFYRKDWFKNSWKFGLNVASQKIAGVRIFTKDKVTMKTQSLKDWLIKLIRIIITKFGGNNQ